MQATEKTFDDIVKAIRSVTSPAAVILFGSYARGEAGEGSDIDLLVLRDAAFGSGESRRRELGRLYRAVSKASSIPKDIILLTTAEFETWQGTTNHMAAEIRREGRVLYGQV